MKTDWKPAIVALAIGIIIGAVGHMRCLPLMGHGEWKNPEKMHQHIMKEFTSKLNLTTDQQQKVSVILDDTRAKISALRQEVRPRFENIRNASKAQIRELLTPGQQEKFDAMTAKMEARMEKRRGEWAR